MKARTICIRRQTAFDNPGHKRVSQSHTKLSKMTESKINGRDGAICPYRGIGCGIGCYSRQEVVLNIPETLGDGRFSDLVTQT